MSAIKTSQGLNRVSISDMLRAAPCFLNVYNSKGRVVPLHFYGAPGVGKTHMADQLARMQAREMPGVPFGVGTVNVGLINPSEAAGYTLFQDHRHPDDHPTMPGVTEKVSVFTRPTSQHLTRGVYVADPAGAAGDPANEVRVVMRDALGQAIYPGSVILCPFSGARLVVLHGLFVLDEFMQGDAEVRKVFAPLLDEGRIGPHELPPGFKVIACSNRSRDASGTGKALAFLTNRQCSMEMERDMPSLLRFAAMEESTYGEPILPLRAPQIDAAGNFTRRAWHPVVMAYAEQNEETLFAGVPSDPNEPFLTPRSLEALANLFDLMLCYEEGEGDTAEVLVIEPGDDPERSRLFTAYAAGIVGSDNAAQFKATVELFGEVPRLSDMIGDPTKAHVSGKKDAQLIAAYVCADGMTLGNGNALIRYAQRLHPSFLGNVVVKAVTRNAELMQVSGIAKYFADNPGAMHRMVSARAKAAAAAGRAR